MYLSFTGSISEELFLLPTKEDIINKTKIYVVFFSLVSSHFGLNAKHVSLGFYTLAAFPVLV